MDSVTESLAHHCLQYDNSLTTSSTTLLLVIHFYSSRFYSSQISSSAQLSSELYKARHVYGRLIFFTIFHTLFSTNKTSERETGDGPP